MTRLTLDARLGVDRDDGARRRRAPSESGGILKKNMYEMARMFEYFGLRVKKCNNHMKGNVLIYLNPDL